MENFQLIEVNSGEITVKQEYLEAFSQLVKVKTHFENMEKSLKEELKQAMEDNDIVKFDNDLFTASYVKPSVRYSVDTKKLAKDHPELAKQYEKETPVKSSIRLKIK